MENKPKIIVCEDHAITLHGIKNVLNSNNKINLVASFNNAESLLNSIDEFEADIILSDLDMPKIDGLELMKRIRKINSKIKFIICTMHINKWNLIKLEKNKVNAIVSKNSVISDLNLAIKKVNEGQKFYSKDIEQILSEKETNFSQFEKILLTSREEQILKLIAKEFSSQQIADKLNLSINTIETHRKNLFLKFEVKNVVGLIKKAMQKGMV